jgi:prepilin-type N-terminal cleavage/methylation domain-containing protein
MREAIKREGVWNQRPAHSRFAFTLVELLVVIVIISMLLGLLFPALQGVREKARQTTCTNNQRELSTAIHGFETAKRRLPGYVNRSVDGSAISWAAVLLPYLGRNDLWEGPGGDAGPSGDDGYGWRDGYNKNTNNGSVCVRINQFVCPNYEVGNACPLAYVVNIGNSYNPTNGTNVFSGTTTVGTVTFSDPGILRCMVSLAGVGSPKSVSLSSVKSPERRPILSERQYTLPNSSSNATKDRQWNGLATATGSGAVFKESDLTGSKLTPMQLGFYWPLTNQPDEATFNAAPFTSLFSPPSSAESRALLHPGIMIVTFCDGHTETISDQAIYAPYDHTTIP